MENTYNLEGLTPDATDTALIMIDNYFKRGSVVTGATDCEYVHGIRDTLQNTVLLKEQGYSKNTGWEKLTYDSRPAEDEVCLFVLFVNGVDEPEVPYIGTFTEAQKHNILMGYNPHNHFLRIPAK
jgi:hypothetical protein